MCLRTFINLSCLSLVLVLTPASPSPLRSQSQNSIDNLTSIEKQRVREIVLMAMQQEDMPTEEIHKEFWSLIRKIGVTGGELERLRESMTNMKSQRYFWEDALWALKQGRPFKSHQTEQYEKELIARGTMTEWRQKTNEQLIEKIASGQPIPFQGGEAVIDEEIVNGVLQALPAVSRRLDRLFTKVWQPEDQLASIREKAEQGDADAQLTLGYLYQVGHAGFQVSQDYGEALKWFLQAAKQGSAQGQVLTGMSYSEGTGIPQDHQEAVKWYRKAAGQGQAMAQFNLGNSYRDGKGVGKDSQEAVKVVPRSRRARSAGGSEQSRSHVRTRRRRATGLCSGSHVAKPGGIET